MNAQKINNGISREGSRKTKRGFRLLFILSGVASTMWVLIRVIPKPSRASYPCIKTAAPLMSAFILYLISLASSVMLMRVLKRNFRKFGMPLVLGFVIMIALSMAATGLLNPVKSVAAPLVDHTAFVANDPIGVAKGIHPGRVVWVWDQNATDENCTNTEGDYWFQNTEGEVVEYMLKEGIKNLAGEDNTANAWDAIFRYFNQQHGRGDAGYSPGEKVYIKINVTNSCCSVNGTTKVSDFHRMDATPEMVLAMLKTLIEDAGVAQEDIYCGDPFRTFHDLYWDMCHTIYPDVVYTDGNGMNGRHQTVPTENHEVFFSDGEHAVRIPQEYVESTYFINMPCLKSHDSGGITLGAKNHQGSILQDGAGSEGQSAYMMHYAFPDNNATPGSYRHLVDYMGHEQLGGKTLLVVVDGIWGGRSWEGYVEKWQMEPFSDDYPNSLFLSQDLVALESVGWDFLLAEYAEKDESEQYPYMSGVEDYILQSADPSEWPEGITYDPENDGTPIESLGVYEHWNNADDKAYTRNLETGDGIELVKVFMASLPIPVVAGSMEPGVIHCFPNPASENFLIEFDLAENAVVGISLFNMSGSTVHQSKPVRCSPGKNQLEMDLSSFKPGIYTLRLEISDTSGITHSVSRNIHKIK